MAVSNFEWKVMTDKSQLAKIVLAQKFARGYIGRRKFLAERTARNREIYQQNFVDSASILKHNFLQNGAAVVLQRWFRRWVHRNKRKWKDKYKKLVLKLIATKKLRRAIRKCKGFKFSKHELEKKEVTQKAAAIVLTRVARGFLGRRRFAKKKQQFEIELKSANKLQSVVRKTIAINRFPEAGLRFRVMQRKQEQYNNKRRKNVINMVDVSTKPRLQKRESFLFTHLKLGGLEFLNKVAEKKALLIQCAWRRKKAYMRRRVKLEEKKMVKLVILQRWFFTVGWRLKIAKAAARIQPIWRARAQKCITERNAAIRIQGIWRTHVKQQWLKSILNVRSIMARKLRRWCRYRLRIRKIRRKLKARRQADELTDAGIYLFKLTEQQWYAHYMWQGAKKMKNVEVHHELQRIFIAYSMNGYIDVGKCVKLMKDCKGIITDSMPANVVEIQFTKVKSTTEKRIDYPKFLELLYNLAIIKLLKVDPSRLHTKPKASSGAPGGAASAGNASAGGTKGAEGDGDAELQTMISSYRVGRLRGRAALITRFIMVFMVTVVDFERILNFLGKKSALSLSQDYISDALRVLQTFVKNRFCVRKCTAYLAQRRVYRLNRNANEKAAVIQKCIRGFLGRRFLMRVAQSVYAKYVDGETEREYWFNQRTERAFWTKPMLLGKFDCGMAVRMPRAEEQFSLNCSVCETVTATCFCEQCNDAYCTPCYVTGHRGAMRKQHNHMVVDNCVQCEFQLATRECVSCKDIFCDSCFKYVHKRGRLRFHVFKRICEVCDVCQDWTAQYRETIEATAENRGQQSQLWCNVCFKRDHEGAEAADYESELLQRIRFYGKAVREFQLKKEEELRKKAIAEAFVKRKAELELAKRTKAALTIQRVYRGRRKRVQISGFLARRREFMRLRNEEAGKRHSLWYTLLSLLGTAPQLKSDTPLERVMKLYPRYYHKILAEAVDGKWTEACRLLVQHEEHLEKQPKSNILQRMMARASAGWAMSSYKSAVRSFEQRQATHASLDEKYRNAKLSGALGPAKMKILRASLTDAEKDLQHATQKKLHHEKALMAAEEHLNNVQGPQGLQKLVKERVKNGVLMPFRVSIRKNSRLALVGWEVDDADPALQSGGGGGGAPSVEYPYYELSQQDSAEETKKPAYNFKPGRWKERLKLHDRVMIAGAVYTIMPPPAVKKKRPLSALKKKKKGDKSGGGDDSASNSMSKSKAPSAGAASSTENKGDSTSRVDASEMKDTTAPTGFEVEVKEEVTEDHIVLDRPWLLDDVYNIPIAKMMDLVFYEKPVRVLGRLCKNSYPAQKAIAVTAISYHKYSNFCKRMATWFDEESPSHAQYLHKAEELLKKRDQWLRHSTTIVQMSYDFTLRRKTWKVLLGVYNTGALVLKLTRNLAKTVSDGAKETPFDYWQRSLEKQDVCCILDLAGEDLRKLGEVKMDLNAPCDILREYIKRAFRDVLNESVGESFMFYRIQQDSGKYEMLERDDEFRTYAKEYAVMKTDSKTMMSAMTVLLMRDPNRGRVIIPAYETPKEEEKEDEELDRLLE